jgi:hypothetical protein
LFGSRSLNDDKYANGHNCHWKSKPDLEGPPLPLRRRLNTGARKEIPVVRIKGAPSWVGITQYSESVTGWTTVILFPAGTDVFSWPQSIPALATTQPPTQCVTLDLSLKAKRPELECDCFFPSNAEIQNSWSYITTPPYVLMTLCVMKHKRSFTRMHSLVTIPHCCSLWRNR